MSVDFGRLRIEQVIVHAIPRASRDDQNPTPLRLSEVVSPLEDSMRAQLQSRLRGDLSASREIVEDPEAESTVPKTLRSYLSGEENDFVDMSQDLAQRLRESQNGSNPDGMLLVAECSLPDSRALMLVKLEHQSGVQASFSDSGGKKTFDVQQVRDLMYTTKSRVYKIAIFLASAVEDNRLAGWVADKQASGGTAAQFFLQGYLGCRPRQDPAEVTQTFYDKATKWVNAQPVPAETKSTYIVSLHAELLSQSSDVIPRAFARKYLAAEVRDNFLAEVCTDGIPVGGFAKDTERIASRLTTIQYSFVSGVLVSAPQSTFDEGIIKLEEGADGKGRLVVEDELAELRGKAKPGKPKKDSSASEGDGSSQEESEPEIK